ncbi:MAG TPA: nodulation protein NfeD [Candidatus Kapabacteria bacterium]|nr:nodulation protein NfeD [Candidatus Kapabacteria bacterium]HOM05630.1 nodulation protein NfeD [Candidatus Kapabacteria bacterium]HPU22883.1 nodulation protein NfeD [Candidatus Kapabacteria bacterium]
MKTYNYIAIVLVLLLSLGQELKSDVIKISVEGGISPATTLFIKNSIQYAEDRKAEALIIQLNTPGGLLDATRDIVQEIMGANVPVVVWIAPSGARAGSAGVFITLAAHIAAMAPGTNIGAAHPVGMGGEKIDSTMNEKITNDAAAFIRSIAHERNKNIDWAERTVRESISATEKESLLAGAIDFIAPNLDSLLTLIDGYEVKIASGTKIISTKGKKVVEKQMTWRESLLFWLANPNIAYILLMIGIYGLLFEFWSPGAMFPGILGAILLMIALYALQMLPLNYAGIGLILIAIILFILEIKVVSYGLLTIAGILSLAIGSIMLIDAPNEIMDISMNLIITVVIITTLLFLVLIVFGIKAQTRRAVTGDLALIGLRGIAMTDISPAQKGQVKVSGEIWSAVSDEEIMEGEEIVVQNVQNFVLKVRKYIA